jgi:hypothetical protein
MFFVLVAWREKSSTLRRPIGLGLDAGTMVVFIVMGCKKNKCGISGSNETTVVPFQYNSAPRAGKFTRPSHFGFQVLQQPPEISTQ